MSKVVLFGTGRGAEVAYRYLTRDSDNEICGFVTDQSYLERNTYFGLPVVTFEEVERHFPPHEFQMLILLGYQRMNALREEKYAQAKAKGYTLTRYVNSSFYRVDGFDVGENCFILDNQSICLDAKIGNNVVMWSSNHIGDLAVLEDHVWVSSHVTIAAEVCVGKGSFLGIGATISNKITLGEKTFVGANALITSDTADNSVHIAGQSCAVEVNSSSFMRIMRAGRKL